MMLREIGQEGLGFRRPRRASVTDGPLYLGKDTHAVSDPAQRTALEVLAANGVDVVIQRNNGVTPTPVISRAILVYNRGRKTRFADGGSRAFLAAIGSRGSRASSGVARVAAGMPV